MKTVECICPNCGKVSMVEMSDDQYIAWKNHAGLIQDIFPEKSMSERELLMTGICEDCWNKLFPEDEVDVEHVEISDDAYDELIKNSRDISNDPKFKDLWGNEDELDRTFPERNKRQTDFIIINHKKKDGEE